MPTLTKTKTRLKTIKSLNAIFGAMQVIAIARLQKIRARHKLVEHYLAELRKIARQMDLSLLLQPQGNKRLAVLMTPNRGFCGAFSQNILFRAQNFAAEAGENTEFIVFGRKGADFLRAKKKAIKETYLAEDYAFDVFEKMAQGIIGQMVQGEISETHLIFNRFRSVMRSDAVANKILPVEASNFRDYGYFIIEPDKKAAGEAILERLVAMELYFAYLDSKLGELSSRMFTLKGAIENSDELIQGLGIELNKARQDAITDELLEIIASSESLKEEELN